MYKVLLADDEVLDLEGMRTFIPWHSLGMEVVGAVNNGFAACEVIETEKIDILVTDIRMPNMSGLELAKRAHEKQKHLRIVFVSGHQDFNYVKQAISLQAHGYVLKPMDDKELIAALARIGAELNENKKSIETAEAYKRMVPIVKNEYLLQLLEMPSDEAAAANALADEYRLDELGWPVQVAVLEIDDYSWKLNPYSEPAKKKLLERFYAMLTDALRENGIGHSCKISKQRIAFLSEREGGEDAMKALFARVKEQFPFTVTIGAGDPVSAMAELHVSYAQAVEALESKMLRGKGKWIAYNNVGASESRDAKSLDVHLEALLAAMPKYDLVRLHDEMSELFRIASQLGSRITIRNFGMYLVMKLNEHLRSMNEDMFRLLGMELKNLDILLQFETIDDIHKWFRNRVFELSEMLHRKQPTKNGKLVQDVIASIGERLHDNITLRDVANRFSFSPNYLGVMFKEETGHNFSDYVITLRMEKARSLLASTSHKIYEIAGMVGYRYLPYFSRQFRETYGMTPLEYRRKH